jgi:hypothetical protein
MEQFPTATWEDLLTDRLVPRRRKEREVKNEIRRRVVKLKATAGCDRFPTDVHSLAKACGIQEVRYLPLAMRGRLLSERGATVAEIDQKLSSRRQRFVLAHEITHLLLSRDLQLKGTTAIYGSNRRSYTNVEHLCDFGAREILLPEIAVRNEVKAKSLSLALVLAIAEEADCDIELVAQCICDLPGEVRVSFLFCRVDAITSEVFRVIPDTSTRFEVTDGKDSLVRRAAQQSSPLRGRQELWAGSTRINVMAEAVASSPETVVMLFSAGEST